MPVPSLGGLRPTGDRVRETLFNWLQHDIRNAHCLDLFAGTGALGFEALSRGAKGVQFVELNKSAANQINANIALLQAEGLVANTDALGWLANYSGAKFDIVFIDPPFAQNLWKPAMAALSESSCLADNALVYLEYPHTANIDIPVSWTRIKEKTAGAVTTYLFQIGN